MTRHGWLSGWVWTSVCKGGSQEHALLLTASSLVARYPRLGSAPSFHALSLPPCLLLSCSPQTCQLVLGAGAIRSAGLKSISAKHLAVSCQARRGVPVTHLWKWDGQRQRRRRCLSFAGCVQSSLVESARTRPGGRELHDACWSRFFARTRGSFPVPLRDSLHAQCNARHRETKSANVCPLPSSSSPQAVHLIVVLLPQLRAGLVAAVPQQRRLLLLPEFDRLIQVGVWK